MKTFRSLLLGASVALVATGAAQAQADGTLQRIKETGEIRIGHRDVSVPFSYLTDEGKPIGFFVDICNRVVDTIKADLKQDVKVVYRPVTLSTQIPLLQNQGVDIVCGPATNTMERQKQVAFSNTLYVSSIRAVVRKDSNINKFSDLNGKTVSVTAASTSINLLTKFEQEHKFETKKLTNPDHSQSFLMFSTGRAQAFVMDDILLASLVANSAKPADFKLIDEALRVEPYGLVMRKDDPTFKAAVDRTLASLVKSGEYQKLYAKWFESNIPPKNVNLNFPMTQALKNALANPNDKGIE
ncbi:amino acid ABC transporter substrate-binding protein [Hydrogenophaga sp. 2FB]|uniref:amino acid ABC transporter substrate-binding protein n=1 Tax=Hydrogenophaga sp. 2FB TaxID=2502187 RepID=UPI0010FA0DB3|nr:amino acid ABC transporter substrate-binding protein [Hydrogenophaga sp. 2FB]